MSSFPPARRGRAKPSRRRAAATPFEMWWRAGVEGWLLGVESVSVIALRLVKLAAGGAPATAEGRRMISEKIAAGRALQARALTGRLGASAPGAARRTIRLYRRRVRANRRRLTKA